LNIIVRLIINQERSVYCEADYKSREIGRCDKHKAKYVDYESYSALEEAYNEKQKCLHSLYEQMSDQGKELEAKLSTYEKMHERSCADILEQDKELEVYKKALLEVCDGMAYEKYEMIRFVEGFAFDKKKHDMKAFSDSFMESYLEKAREGGL